MALSVQVPTVGQPNSTEAVKVTNSLTNLSTWANGNVQDTDLNSPNNSVRKLLLHSNGSTFGGSTYNTLGTDYLLQFDISSLLITSGAAMSANLPWWIPDQGLSGQPKDFSVANKTAKARIRAIILVNSTAPGLNVTFGLYQLTALGGGNSSTIAPTFGTAVAGTTVTQANPLAAVAYMLETAEFNLPQVGNPHALGVNLSGGTGTVTANNRTIFQAQLYGYNA